MPRAYKHVKKFDRNRFSKTRTDRWTDGRTDGRTDRQMDGETDSQTDRQSDIRADRQKQTDRRTDGVFIFTHLKCTCNVDGTT